MVYTNDGASQVPMYLSIIWVWFMLLLLTPSNVVAFEDPTNQVTTSINTVDDASLFIGFPDNQDAGNVFPRGNTNSIDQTIAMESLDISDAPHCDPLSQSKNEGGPTHRYDPLACWLWKLQVIVPDQKIKKGVFSVSIKGMKCTNFAIGSIQSSYIASSSKSKDNGDPSILVGVSGISAVCVGEYKSTGMSGTVRAIVKSSDTSSINTKDNKSPLELDIIFVSGYWQNQNHHTAIRLAKSVKTNSCKADLQVPEHGGLHFSGSASAKFIDLFSKPIAKYVSSALSSQLCPIIKSSMDPALTKLIQEADDYMTSLILPNNNSGASLLTGDGIAIGASFIDRNLPSLSAAQEDEAMIDLKRDTPLLNVGLQVGNEILDRYLNKGILLDLLGETGEENNRTKSKDLIVGDANCPDCGYFFRGFNGVIRSLTNGTGEFQFDIPKPLHKLSNITFVVPKYAQASILIKHIYVSGLDTLSGIDLFRPSSSNNNSFISSVGSNTGFNVSISVDIEVTSIPGGMFQGDPLKESFHVDVNSSAAHLLSEMMFGINQEQFTYVTVGNVISAIRDAIDGNFTNVMCLVGPLKVLNISDLMADIDLLGISFVPEISNDESKGQLEKDIDRMLNNFLHLFIGEYNVLVTETLKGASKGPVTMFINQQIAKLIHSISPDKEGKGKNVKCLEKHGSDMKPPDFVDFRNFAFLKKMNHFLNSSNALRPINRYISCIEAYVNQMLPPTYNMSIGGITLSLQDVHIHNLGSLNELEIVDPELDGFHLHNSIGFAHCDEYFNSGTCNIPRITFGVEVNYPKFNISGEAQLTASIGNFSATGGGNIHFDMNKFRSLSLPQLLSRAQCMGVSTSVLSIYDISGTLGIIDLNVNASLDVASFDPVQIDFQGGKNESVAAFASSALSWSLESLEDFFNQISILVLPKMAELCERPSNLPLQTNKEEKDNTSIMLLWNGLFFVVAMLVAQISILLFLRWRPSFDTAAGISMHHRSEAFAPSHNNFHLEPTMEPLISHDTIHTLESPGVESTEDVELKMKSAALMHNGNIPGFVRHGLAIITIGTVLLLLSSNLSVGASVNATVTIADSKPIELPSLFAFSLGNTVREFYSAGIFALLFLVLVFSGLWPYVKLFMMLFAWMAPRRLLSQQRREHCLLTLDSLSKFSLVDAYVLVLMLVAFRFHLNLEEAAVIDVFVTPGYGFYGFLLATTMSLVIGETMLYYHRRVSTSISSCGSRESICQHEFGNTANGQKRLMTRSFQMLVVALALFTLVLLAVGVTKESFNFEFGGLAGILLGDERLKSYSVVSLGSSLPMSVEDPTSIGISFIQVAYFFYAIVTPFTCIAIVLVLFLCPMTLQTQRTFVSIAEIANAWSAIEVFVLSVVAALFEISTFAQFIIGDKCDLINDILSKHFDEQMQGDDTCYSVKASVGSNVCYLVLGVVLNSFLISTLLRFIHCAMAERIARESKNGQLRSDATHVQTLVDFLIRWNLENLVFGNSGTSLEDGSEAIVRDSLSPSRLWEDWRNMCSWT